jgi:hypothetical protein
MPTEIRRGWILELIPRDPPPVMENLILVGEVMRVDPPEFELNCDFGEIYRADNAGELCVRRSDRALFAIGRTCKGPLNVIEYLSS